ncbi:MAG: type III pantothenate kinase [Planctomycetes bacterium]|nr:type III pantothenate kinase [Planctomycetota bacterium]
MSSTSPGLLTVDRGNSTIDCQRHDDGARLAFDVAAADPAPLLAFLRRAGLRSAVACSVVREGLAAVESELAAAGVALRIAGRDFGYPLVLDYETPATLGADRWVGAFGAWQQHGRSIVVDCGTATTVNLVEADGTFRGGPIAPGLRAFAAGMAAVTPALPAPAFDAEPQLPPRSSQAAVDVGVLLGYCGMVERLVAATLAVARGPARVVVTGGHAARLLRRTRLRATHTPDLVHRGLRALAERLACGC